MDATRLLGAMVGSDYGRGRGPGLGTMAVGALGVAAVGGLGYLAYQHFKGQPGAGPGASTPQAGYPQAGYPQAGYPQAGYPQGGPMGAPMGGPAGGFMGSIMGGSGTLRTDGFSAPGYEHQMGQSAPAAQPAPPPPVWGTQPQPPAAAAAATPAVPPAYVPPPPPPIFGADGTPVAAPPVAAPAAAAPAAPAAPQVAPSPEQQRHALLLVRAMIAASFADGVLDEKERADILSRLDAAGVRPDERAAFVQELAAPRPVTALVAEVTSPELAEQFYLVSAISISQDSEPEKAHLRMLPALLRLSPEQVASLHQRASLPPP